MRDRIDERRPWRLQWIAAALMAVLLPLEPAVAGVTSLVFDTGGSNAVSDDGRWVVVARFPAATWIVDRLARRLVAELPHPEDGWDVTPDGRFVVVSTKRGDLVAGDTNGETDVYLYDRDADGNGIFDEAGVSWERISVATDGSQYPDWTAFPSISDDGRLVGFAANGSNLGPGYPSVVSLVRDRARGRTELVGVDALGEPLWTGGPTMVPDGSGVLYEGHDWWLRPLGGIAANLGFFLAKVVPNRDASTLVLETDAALDPADTNGEEDLYFHDVGAGTSRRAAIDWDPREGALILSTPAPPSMSGDGRRTVFHGYPLGVVDEPDVFFCPGNTQCVDVFVYDRDTDADGVFDEPAASKLLLVTRSTSGVRGNANSGAPAISRNGRFVVFPSFATNLDDLRSGFEVGIDGNTFVRDLTCGDGRLEVSAGEECDDGNLIDGDGCDSICVPTACGNFVVSAGEECDDGNLSGGDGCEADCRLPAGTPPGEKPPLCSVPTCLLDSLAGAECAGSVVPRKFTRKLRAAAGIIDTLQTEASPRRLKKARKLLRAARKALRGRKPSAACKGALRQVVTRLLDGQCVACAAAGSTSSTTQPASTSSTSTSIPPPTTTTTAPPVDSCGPTGAGICGGLCAAGKICASVVGRCTCL